MSSLLKYVKTIFLIVSFFKIREVICFPLNQNAQDPLMGAPNEATDKQLRELNLVLSPVAREALAKGKANQ